MKKLFTKGFIFVSVIFAACACFVYLSASASGREMIAWLTDSEEFMEESETLPYFERVRVEDGTTKLVIGESICDQLFTRLQEYNPDISFQASNAAFLITGQYLLMEEYLKFHPDARDVFLVIHPAPLTRTFDTEWGYRYGAMTYVAADVLGGLDENTIEAMEGVYGSFFMKKETVRFLQDSPLAQKICLSYLYANREDYVQGTPFEIADQYVKKMYDLCRECGAELHLYSSPVSEFFRGTVETLGLSYGETWMSSVYPDYFNDIMYYPSEWSRDMSHFGGEYATPEGLNQIIEAAYGDTELFRSLRFGPGDGE